MSFKDNAFVQFFINNRTLKIPFQKIQHISDTNIMGKIICRFAVGD